MSIKDTEKTIEAVKELRRELARKYHTWNSQSFEDFKKRASRILDEHGIPEPWWQDFSPQFSSSDESPPYAIVQTDLNGNGTMTTSSGTETSSADNLLTKIERAKDALDSILKRLGCPISQEDF